jgi:hypothetical protein
MYVLDRVDILTFQVRVEMGELYEGLDRATRMKRKSPEFYGRMELTLAVSLPFHTFESAQPGKLTPKYRHTGHVCKKSVEGAGYLLSRRKVHESVFVVELGQEERMGCRHGYREGESGEPSAATNHGHSTLWEERIDAYRESTDEWGKIL